MQRLKAGLSASTDASQRSPASRSYSVVGGSWGAAAAAMAATNTAASCTAADQHMVPAAPDVPASPAAASTVIPMPSVAPSMATGAPPSPAAASTVIPMPNATPSTAAGVGCVEMQATD